MAGSTLQEELRTIDVYIVRWATRKYKRFQGHTMATWDWLRSVNAAIRDCSHIGAWDQRPDDRSRMNREVHVRFWESAGLQCSAPLDYLKDYESVSEARAGLERYFRFYNQERLHQSLQYRTPAAIWLARG
jgi:transposase InsO family protein